MGKLGIQISKKALKQGYQERESEYGEKVDLEPGRYIGVVKSMRGVKTEKGDNVVFDIVVGGDADEAGGEVSIFQSVEAERIKHLFRLLKKLGFDTEDIPTQEDLEEIAQEIEDNPIVVKFSVKLRGGYTNINIISVEQDTEPSEVLPDSSDSKTKDEDDDEDEEEDDDEEEEDDFDLDEMSRKELKAFIKNNKLSVRVVKSMSDDDIRAKIEKALK